MAKIGIFSGTFDPVHKGHIAFALQAAEAAGLDRIYFLPESVPRRKEGVTHYAHRIAMLRIALKPYKKLAVLDLPDKQFSVKQTLPRLTKRFKNSELYLLLGSDAGLHLASGAWPSSDVLLASAKLIVGLRTGDDEQAVAAALQSIVPERTFYIIQTENQHASSRDIRSSFERGKKHESALLSLEQYIRQNWLYVSAAVSTKS